MLRCDVNRIWTVCFPFSGILRNFIVRYPVFSTKRYCDHSPDPTTTGTGRIELISALRGGD
jgi:hypothetical protein